MNGASKSPLEDVLNGEVRKERKNDEDLQKQTAEVVHSESSKRRQAGASVAR